MANGNIKENSILMDNRVVMERQFMENIHIQVLSLMGCSMALVFSLGKMMKVYLYKKESSKEVSPMES